MADKTKKPRPGWAITKEKRLDIKQLFAQRLEALMTERGLNQSELAREAAKFMSEDQNNTKQKRGHKPVFHRDNISKYLKRDSPVLPRPEHLYPLARALGIEADYLMPRGTPMAPKQGVRVMTSNKPGRQHVVLSLDLTPEAYGKIMAIVGADGALGEL